MSLFSSTTTFPFNLNYSAARMVEHQFVVIRIILKSKRAEKMGLLIWIPYQWYIKRARFKTTKHLYLMKTNFNVFVALTHRPEETKRRLAFKRITISIIRRDIKRRTWQWGTDERDGGEINYSRFFLTRKVKFLCFSLASGGQRKRKRLWNKKKKSQTRVVPFLFWKWKSLPFMLRAIVCSGLFCQN